ncbi:MAG: GDSL-type esterase/lipase family protein [Myxococcota bacterium]|nr:GDSL-type esterase/lipase family protein [Myxococcota bacterium]
MSKRPSQPEPFLRGCAWPASSSVPYPRCDPGPEGTRLPDDTRSAAALPVGVRFSFSGEPEEIEIEYETQTSDLGYRGDGAGTRFVLYRGNRPIDQAEAKLGRGRVALSPGKGPEPATLYLPEGMRPQVLALHARGGSIEAIGTEPRWLCYGDSIAEGWCATEPALAWPHILARQHGLDVINLGYAGAARGEIASAQEIASLPADLISISHGTNCWSRTPHSAPLFAESLRAFIEIVRTGHPDLPVVAISPIVRPDAEDSANLLGATLSDLRARFEEVIEERIEAGDENLILVPGRDLVDPTRLPDGIHPGDEGHTELARALGPILARAAQQGADHA